MYGEERHPGDGGNQCDDECEAYLRHFNSIFNPYHNSTVFFKEVEYSFVELSCFCCCEPIESDSDISEEQKGKCNGNEGYLDDESIIE
jgi:hypothetical protein